jgi:hypothetical protein
MVYRRLYPNPLTIGGKYGSRFSRRGLSNSTGSVPRASKSFPVQLQPYASASPFCAAGEVEGILFSFFQSHSPTPLVETVLFDPKTVSPTRLSTPCHLASRSWCYLVDRRTDTHRCTVGAASTIAQGQMTWSITRTGNAIIAQLISESII